MLYDALAHASQFKCKVVVVMHLWKGYPPYRNFLRGVTFLNSVITLKWFKSILRHVPLHLPLLV